MTVSRIDPSTLTVMAGGTTATGLGLAETWYVATYVWPTIVANDWLIVPGENPSRSSDCTPSDGGQMEESTWSTEPPVRPSP